MPTDYTVTRKGFGNGTEAEILEDDESIEVVIWNKNKPGEEYYTYDKTTGQTTAEKFPKG